MKVISIISFLLAGVVAQAQQTADINSIPGDLQPDPNVVEVEAPQYVQPSAGVVILNSQTSSGKTSARANKVLQQPTTYVQASPIVESRAEQMRKQRQQVEINTEQKIVEKLEQSRIEDEKERAARLFGDKWTKPQEPAQQQPQYQQPIYGQQQQPAVVAPAVVNVDEEEDSVKREELEDMKSEIIGAVRESQQEKAKLDLEAYKNKDKKKAYVGAILGAGEYRADNVESNGAVGVAIGSYVDDHLAIEGSFLYSNFTLDEFWKRDFYKEIDQYDFSVGAKYSVLPGRIKPYVGGTISYIYRNYTDRTDEYYGYEDFGEDEEITSHAVNAALGFGLDFFVSPSFSLGFDYRYSVNVFNNSDSDFLRRSDFREPSNTEPLEEVGFSVFAFTSKIAF